MSLLKNLETKEAVDAAITSSPNMVVVLRMGRADDVNCMRIDDIVCRRNLGEENLLTLLVLTNAQLMQIEAPVSRMASIYTVDVGKVGLGTCRQRLDNNDNHLRAGSVVHAVF